MNDSTCNHNLYVLLYNVFTNFSSYKKSFDAQDTFNMRFSFIHTCPFKLVYFGKISYETKTILTMFDFFSMYILEVAKFGKTSILKRI